MYFQSFGVIAMKWANYVWHAERLMKESWEAGSSRRIGDLYIP
jgi:hypothetical protein